MLACGLSGCANYQPKTRIGAIALERLETKFYPEVEESLVSVLDAYATLGEQLAEQKQKELIDKINSWKPEVEEDESDVEE